MMKIYFVGGVHGVGKTSACRKVAEDLKITHTSASEIISKVKSGIISPKSKKVTEIKSNQDLLI